MFRFGKKMPLKNIYFTKHQKHILVLSRIRIRIFKTGSADPDPKKNGRDPQHGFFGYVFTNCIPKVIRMSWMGLI